MHTQHKIMLKRDISLTYATSFEKPYVHSKKTTNKTYSLKQYHVLIKTNNAKSSQVNTHINIIEKIIKTTISSGYHINKHV